MSETLQLPNHPPQTAAHREPVRLSVPKPILWSAGIVLAFVVLVLAFSGGDPSALATGWSELYPAP